MRWPQRRRASQAIQRPPISAARPMPCSTSHRRAPMRKYAVIFVHGLAKKPPPAKLEEIWRWGLSRPDPNEEAFPHPNPGIDLDVEGVPALFNYYADVFYGEDYETEFG